MKAISKLELKLENFEKCHLILDSDCPLGQLYDYSCSLKHFITEKMKEAEELDRQNNEEKREKIEAI